MTLPRSAGAFPERIALDGLVLRAWRTADAAAFAEACRDPEIPRWTGFPYALDRAGAERLIEERIRGHRFGRCPAFAIADPADRLLGSATFRWLDREQATGGIAYWLAADSRGRGIGTHAVQGLCAWAFTGLALDRLELTVDVRNTPSQRLAERVGFRRGARLSASQMIHGQAIDEFRYVRDRG